MVNPFLSSAKYDTETAIMLEQANILDIGNAVAYTDGNKVFLNTEENLLRILPAYDDNMLKWLLWHERMHKELKHHNRFFKYLKELEMLGLSDEFAVTKNEVNIIMDILVHDWMCSKFPELIETALNNLAQMRDRNSLKYTFKTFSLEEMLEEYRKHKHPEEDESKGGDGDDEDKKEKEESSEGSKTTPLDEPKKDEGDKEKEEPKEKPKEEPKKKKSPKAHASGGHSDKEEPKGETPEESKPEDKESEQPEPEPAGHHDETDWSKLDEIDSKEFITESESDDYMRQINRLKNIKIRLAKITKTLNGLVTTTKVRSYKSPSHMQTGQNTIFKGRQNGKSALYLCFDASGSMSGEMELFKEIITKAIPQAMNCPCEWFSGYGEKIEYNPEGRSHDYYKGTFKDFIPVHANCGYSDDGDRTIELCYKAEQLGYSPIGVTDGGGQLSWSKPLLRQLKRTVLIGHNEYWLKLCQECNPKIQIIEV